MKNSYIIAVVVAALALLAIAVFTLKRGGSEVAEPNPLPIAAPSPSATESAQEEQKEATIIYDSDGFTPETLTVIAGTVVTFVNESGSLMWPASAVHPTHTRYPGSGIAKCGTDEEAGIFDACEGLPTGEIYSFVFSETGKWGYHNHLSPGDTGTVVVQ